MFRISDVIIRFCICILADLDWRFFFFKLTPRATLSASRKALFFYCLLIEKYSVYAALVCLECFIVCIVDIMWRLFIFPLPLFNFFSIFLSDRTFLNFIFLLPLGSSCVRTILQLVYTKILYPPSMLRLSFA